MMEPHATIAAWAGDQLALWTANQMIDWTADDLAGMLGIPHQDMGCAGVYAPPHSRLRVHCKT